MLYLSLSLLILVIVLLWKRVLSRFMAKLLFVPLSASAALSLFYVVSDSFTGVGIDQSVIYHLQVGLEGAGVKEYAFLILVSLLLLIGWLLLYFVLLWRSTQRSMKQHAAVTAGVLALSSIVLNPGALNLYAVYMAQPSAEVSDAAQELYHDYIGQPQISSTGRPLNIIYIYAESLEETYFNETLFPGLLPNLQALRKQAIVFENVEQVTNTGWTIAGMVGSQCGVPLFMSGGGNSLSGMTRFMSGATCMGDVLQEQGYFLSYMGGASTKFAGKGNFYRTHGFKRVQGLEELEQKQSNPEYKSSWGIYDDELFEFAHQELSALQSAGEPFGLFMLTLDTHHPRGHLSKSCAGLKYPHRNDAMLDAVHCADMLLAKFIKDIQQKGLTDNTLIVLGSDHLAMKNTVYDILEQGDRKNFLLMIPPGLSAGARVEATASTLDIGATALALMGFDLDGVGFGRNILAEEPTLMAANESFSQTLDASRPALKHIWQYPSLSSGVKVVEQNKAVLGGVEYSYPFLALTDQKLAVKEVYFDFDGQENVEQRIASLELGEGYVWIDKCTKLNELHKGQEYNAGYCISAGRLGVRRSLYRPARPGKVLSRKQLNKLYSKKRTVDQQRVKTQIAELAGIGGVQSHTAFLPSLEVEHLEILSSPGPGVGQSGLSYRVGQSRYGNNEIGRGLNLILLHKDAAPTVVLRIDGCARQPAEPVDKSLLQEIEKTPGGQFLLLVHDSAHCGESAWLKSFFSGTKLARGANLAVRQSYAALVLSREEMYELAGWHDKQLKITVVSP